MLNNLQHTQKHKHTVYHHLATTESHFFSEVSKRASAEILASSIQLGSNMISINDLFLIEFWFECYEEGVMARD